jgi:uncharacterized integral membrane protein
MGWFWGGKQNQLTDGVFVDIDEVFGSEALSLIGVGLLLIFMIQNTESVRLEFLVWSFTWPLWLLTMASAVVGALVWFGLGVMRRHRRRKERRHDRRD